MPLIHPDSRPMLAGVWPSILVLLAVALAGGLDDARSEAAAIGPVDACALLTRADVESVYGLSVGEAKSKEIGSGAFWVSMCNYDNAETDAPMLSVGILIKAHGAAEGPAQAYDDTVAEMRETLGEAAVPALVEGIGERAGWSADISQLMVFEGPYSIILTASGRFEGDRLAAARQLADRVLSRLRVP